MSTVFDVSNISINDGPEVSVGSAVQSVVITDAMQTPSVTLTVPQEVESVVVSVPGPQGAAGLKNVYPQLADPSVENGWTVAEKGFVWIEVNV